jgi:cell division protein FtsL
MNIDHGLMNVWIEGDAITRAVALLLLACVDFIFCLFIGRQETMEREHAALTRARLDAEAQRDRLEELLR